MLNFSQDILLKQSLSGTTINSYAPFTLSINPSGIDGLTTKVYKIEYYFSNSKKINQTWFYQTSAVNSGLAYQYDVGDPRNYSQNHTYYLPNTYTFDYPVSCKIFQIGNSNPITISFTIRLSAPKMDGTLNGFFSAVHLNYTRMFGYENNILYVFETENPKYFIPVVFNWKNRPVKPPEIIIDEGYRPYRIFEPYENERVSNAYEHIDFFNDQEFYNTGGSQVPPAPPVLVTYLVAGNSYNSVTDKLITSNGFRIIIS